MKKKILILFGVIFALICSGLMLFNFGKNINTLIGSASASSSQAVTTEDSTQTVNFYGADNETIIYSVEVPTGSSLNDLSNNLLKNSNFSDYNNSNVTVNSYYMDLCSYWSNYYSGADIEFNDNGALIIRSSFTYFFIYQKLDNIYLNTDYTLSFKVNDVLYTGTITTPSSYPTSFAQYTVNGNGFLARIRYEPTQFPETTAGGGTGFYFDLYFGNNATNSFEIEYVKVQQGLSSTPYFELDYLNKLYRNSGGFVDNYFVWSQSPNNDTRFDFDTPLYSDLNLYGYSNGGNEIHETYTGELEPRISDFGAYALKDIVSFNIDGYFLFRGTYTPTEEAHGLSFYFQLNKNINLTNVNAFAFNGISGDCFFDLNLLVCSVPNPEVDVGNIGSQTFFKHSVSSYNGDYFSNYYFDESCYGNDYYIYFSNYAFNLNKELPNNFSWSIDTNSIYNKDTKYIFTENLESIVDMNSNTNFGIPFFGDFSNPVLFSGHNSVDYLSYLLINYVKNDNSFLKNFCSGTVSDGNIFVIADAPSGLVNLKDLNYTIEWVEVRSLRSFTNNFDISFYLEKFYFVVDKPVYRVNNSLLIYNYDYYNTLVNINSVNYELYRDEVFYDVVYNGVIPNYKYIYISNDAINNTIFDRYIFVHFDFNNGYIPITKEAFISPYQLGFDFNFSYFQDPLISDAGIYNYEFEKPGYVDMPISLFPPFHIPFMEFLENAIIFLVFYCPVISQILSALYFDQFFGGLLTVFNFIANSAIGDFVLGCLAFIILWGVLKALFPTVVVAGRDAFSSASFIYHDRKLKRLNKNRGKELRAKKFGNLKIRDYQKYKDKYSGLRVKGHKNKSKRSLERKQKQLTNYVNSINFIKKHDKK